MDATRLNDSMVDALVEQGQVRDPKVEGAFRAVHRHLFLPGVPLERVYSGAAVPVRFDDEGHATSSSSEPAIMAIMLRQLDVQLGHRVLEVGTGTGYNAALLSHLVGQHGRVTTMDIEADLTAAAREHLKRAGFGEVEVVTGDGWRGVAGGGPYDRIEVTVGVWDLSRAWVDQLREGGILVAPLWLRGGVQASIAFERQRNELVGRSVELCGFMRLRGPHAGPESYAALDDGWSMALDEPGRDRADLVRELLGTSPRIDTTAQPPSSLSDWFVSIALTEPGAIRMWRIHDDGSVENRAGLLDVNAGGLALVEEDRLLAFGDGAAAEALRAHLSAQTTLDLRQVHVTATPHRGSLPVDVDWHLLRPEHRFDVTLSDTRSEG